MQRNFAVRQFAREFLSALVQEFKASFGWPSPLEVREEAQDRLVLLANRRLIVADRKAKTVRSGGRLLASFNAITSIEIKHSHNNEGPEVWVVSLRLIRDRRVVIGESADDTDASLVAAKLSTITGKKVLAFA